MKQPTQTQIKEAIKDIVWMARRYADGRMTYAPIMFNDAYDILRQEFGDDIDKSIFINDQGEPVYDIALKQSNKHPYALYRNETSPVNQEIVNRPFYKQAPKTTKREGKGK